MSLIDFKNLVWSSNQTAIIEASLSKNIFCRGPAGTGKTTAAVARLAHLVESGIPAESILVLVPQRNFADSFYDPLLFPPFSSILIVSNSPS
jgi:DNA helicase IV